MRLALTKEWHPMSQWMTQNLTSYLTQEPDWQTENKIAQYHRQKACLVTTVVKIFSRARKGRKILRSWTKKP